MRLYRYVFYRFYMHQSRWKGWDATPHYTALLLLTCVVWMHTLTVSCVVEALAGVRLFPPLSKPQVLITCAVILLLQYALLVRGRGHQRIVAEFSATSPALSHGVFTAAYLIVSFVLLVVSARWRFHALGQ